MEKKFFVPELYPLDHDLKKKWFVYYYEPRPGTNISFRVKVYENINRSKTVEGRLRIAEKIIQDIHAGKTKSAKLAVKLKKGAVLHDILESHKHTLRNKTYITYRGQIDRWRAFLGKKSELEATKSDALKFIQKLWSEGMRPKTVKTYQQNLKSIYRKYAELNDLEGFKNPFRNMASIKSESVSLSYFNDNQIGRIKEYLQAQNPMIWLICQLQFYCFIRPNEIRQLRSKTINLSAGWIEIEGSFSKNKKTQKVAIPEAFAKDLQFVEGLEPQEYLFPGSDPEKPIHRNTMTLQHKEVLKKLGIKGNYSLYSWKHTGVTKAVKAGLHIKDLQLQLRHHSLDMVNEYLKNLGVMDMDRIKDLFPSI